MVETILKDPLSGDDVTKLPVKVPVFLPEDILRCLMGEIGLVIEEDAVQKYWQHARDHGCPWKDMSPGHHHPLGLYGDAAKYSPTGSKIIAYFLNLVLWAPKTSRMSRWLLFTLENDQCLGAESLNPLFGPIVESLNRCYNGINIGGRTTHYVCTELRGDWEWHVSCFGLQRTWRHHTFCWRCDVSRGPGEPYQYWDFSDNPGWATTEKSHVEFLSSMVSSRRP